MNSIMLFLHFIPQAVAVEEMMVVEGEEVVAVEAEGEMMVAEVEGKMMVAEVEGKMMVRQSIVYNSIKNGNSELLFHFNSH